MKILHLADSFLPSIGGVQIVVHSLACQQQNTGHDVTVLTQRRRVKALAGQVPYTVLGYWPGFSHAARSGQSGWSRAWFAFFVRFLQKKYAFDVWHLHNTFPEALFLPALQQCGVPCVLTSHGDEFCTGTAQEQCMRQQLLPLVQRLAVLCPASRAYALHCGLAKEAVVDVDNGLTPSAFALPIDKNAERARYRLPENVLLFISAGRNAPEKGFDLIVPVMQALRAQGYAFHWCVVGRGSEKIAAHAQAAGLGEYLTAIPPFELIFTEGTLQHPNPDYARLLQSADVYVGLSRTEAFYLALYEGLAAGLAGVFTNTARAPELEASGCGIMVPADDVFQTVQALTHMFNAPFRLSCAQQGRAFVQRYEWPAIARKYIEIYKDIAMPAGLKRSIP